MANAGKTVIVAALDGTYQKRPFGRVLELVPLAESVTKLSAVCMVCKHDAAAFSQRISREREVEVIGGPEKYVALCRACYLRFTFVFPPPPPLPLSVCLSRTHVCVSVCPQPESQHHGVLPADGRPRRCRAPLVRAVDAHAPSHCAALLLHRLLSPSHLMRLPPPPPLTFLHAPSPHHRRRNHCEFFLFFFFHPLSPARAE